jgi:polyhydroxybutyrate depolymerase
MAVKKYSILILFVLTIFNNSYSQTQQNRTMFFDGNNREYIIYVPAIYDGSEAYPLMFSFHGGGGTSNDFININDMRSVADTAGFIAVYPQAAVDPNDGSNAWLHKAPTSHDDVFFIEAIIDTLSNDYFIDNNRVYACGYSEGGIFSYELGCRLNNRIAAFASVSGSMMVDAFRDSYYNLGFCSPVHPTAVMLIPGTNDMNPHSTYTGFQPYYMSADEITTYWSNYNNTDTNPIISQLPNINTSDGSTVEHRVWENGDNCLRVEELKVNGGEHDWPGTFGNMDINATTEIWDFVSQFNINGLINCSSTFQNNLTNSSERKLVKTIDVLGRESTNVLNNLILYIYDDGSIDKVFVVE